MTNPLAMDGAGRAVPSSISDAYHGWLKASSPTRAAVEAAALSAAAAAEPVALAAEWR